MFETKITVRYAETDQMGVVYYANYYVWFEVARTELLREQGFEYALLEKAGYFLPVVESYARYFKPAHYGDDIRIVSRVKEILKSRIMTFDYSVYHRQILLATGYTRHICVDRHKKPVSLPAGLVKKIKS